MTNLNEIKSLVEKLAPEYNIKRVNLFGSYAEGRATDNSDIDLLVEYHQTPSLLKLLGFKNRMQDALKKTVDIVRYPINQDNLYYRNFKIGKEIPLYG